MLQTRPLGGGVLLTLVVQWISSIGSEVSLAAELYAVASVADETWIFARAFPINSRSEKPGFMQEPGF